MKKTILAACAALLLPLSAWAGDVAPGSVPGTLNYQGRLERDNAPITGPIHLYFRVYNHATANNTGGGLCGAVAQPCLWQSPEITVQAAQGIFSADLTPPLSVLSGGIKLYLEVQVESDVLQPREPLNSVAYALLAKKLEDGASVSVTTLTALNNVMLSTAAGAYLTVGTDAQSSAARVTVDGSVKILNGSLIFANGTSMNTAGVGSASNIASVSDADILADSLAGNTAASGDVLFRKASAVFMRITNSGKAGIGPTFTVDSGLNPPGGGTGVAPLLDVDGQFYVGNEGIYDRDDSEVNVKEDLVVEGGKVSGYGSTPATLANISLGETPGLITFNVGAAEKMRIHNTNSFVGIGLAAPTAMLHVLGDVRSNAGVRGGAVSVGTYAGDWTGYDNELRAQAARHLLLQQTNSYNVGIGTDAPKEKLHVRGSVRSDYGLIAATAAFSGDVRVNGTFTANSGQGNRVYLSTTTVYGDLIVTGGIGSLAGIPAYLASTQTFTGLSAFQNQVVVSSDILTLSRLGAGVSDFDFAGTKYLQVGDNKPAFANDNAMAYLVGGANADAKLNFYRGAAELGRIETQTTAYGTGLAQVLNGQTKVFTDAVYHHIQNSAVWISTGYRSTPAIFVSSFMGNVGMGTAVMDPNWRLTVDGNIRLSGALSNALIFADGTSLNTASALGSATNLSSNGDAVVQSNADLSGGGDVVLRAGALDGLILNTGGNVGIGTMFPVAKLNVRSGDLVIGAPYNPYSGDSSEDLVVAGNIAFDGEMVQRSALPVYLSKLVVSNDVYLSTTVGTRTGIGNVAPGYTLDVTGDINTSASLRTGGTARISNTGTVGSGGANATWDGVTINVNRGGTGAATFTDGGILFGNGTGAIGATAVLANGQLLIGDGTQEPTAATLTGTANQVIVTNGAGSIALSLPQNIHTTADPSFDSISVGSATLATALTVPNGGTGATTLAGIVKGNGTAAMTAVTGTLGYITYWSDANTIAAEQYASVTRGGTGVGSLTGVVKGNGTSAMSAMTGTANRLTKWSDANTIANSIISDNGTTVSFTGGLAVTGTGSFTGNVTMNGTGRINNLVDPAADQDAATRKYVDDQVLGGASPAWSKYGNTVSGSNYMGSSNFADVIFKTNDTRRMAITAGGGIQLGTGVNLSTFTSAGVLQLAASLGVAYGGTGANTFTASQLVRMNAGGTALESSGRRSRPGP